MSSISVPVHILIILLNSIKFNKIYKKIPLIFSDKWSNTLFFKNEKIKPKFYYLYIIIINYIDKFNLFNKYSVNQDIH